MSDLKAARAGDERAFARLVAPHRRELLVHCYRMLGGLADAEDAVQETFVAAWRGLAGFEERSSLRAWLYRIATNAALRIADRRPPRMLSWDRGPARGPTEDLGEPVEEGWLDPWPHDVAGLGSDPEARLTQREAIELAFVAAMQHLPPNQRAVLILRDVLAFSAVETANLLDTSVASVTSALQRARASIADRVPSRSQQTERAAADSRRIVSAFVDAFERGDVDAVVRLLSADVRFTMPPLPAWFDGRDDVAGFFARRVFATPWRTRSLGDVNGQPAVLGYQGAGGDYRPGSLMVLGLHGGEIAWISCFLDPELLADLDAR